MKRLSSNKSGKEIYGQKWQMTELSSDEDTDSSGAAQISKEKQITESSSELKSDEELHSAPAVSSGAAQISGIEAAKEELPKNHHDGSKKEQTPKGKREGSRMDKQSMYKAALDGDWIAAEVLLGRDPTLASVPITEKGDRALHVAAAMKHKKLVRKLVECMHQSELELVDGRDYTACCYAAISGVVEIARIMIEKNPNLITACYQKKVMPLHRAANRGNKAMVSYFLKITKIGDLDAEQWFDLLLVTIRRNMLDVAIKIVEINGSLATMADKEGTALHVLARQFARNADSFWKSLLPDSVLVYAYESPRFGTLAKKLWALMQQLENDSLLKLITTKHRILHDAAKTGHAKLVTMIIGTYPQLLWETDGNKHTLLHVAVRYRQYDVLRLIPKLEALIDLTAESQDEDGNNILHLAAKLVPRDRVKASQSVSLLQLELNLFKSLEAMVSPSCLEMINKDGLTPRELFSKEHKSLFEFSQIWMKNTSDSFILIATILLTVVFGAAFSVPGGYDGETGEPVLMEEDLSTYFLMCEVFAVLCSALSIIMFRSVLASRFAEDEFVTTKLPIKLYLGFSTLYFALVFTVAAFMISISLQSPHVMGAVLVGSAIISLALPYWIVTIVSTLLASTSPLKRNRPVPIPDRITKEGEKMEPSYLTLHDGRGYTVHKAHTQKAFLNSRSEQTAERLL